MLTLVSALAVAKGIEHMVDLPVQIKWPNDIVINGKKVCGILTEMSAQMDYVNHIVIGIGINVHNEEFPEEIAKVATSIYMETGKHVNRAALIEKVWETARTLLCNFHGDTGSEQPGERVRHASDQPETESERA